MITIPLYTILFAYLAGVFLCAVLLLVDWLHLVRTGTFTLASLIVTIVALAGTAIIFWATWYWLQGTVWQTPVTLWDNTWLGAVFSREEILAPFK